jgi:hypothetical protein
VCFYFFLGICVVFSFFLTWWMRAWVDFHFLFLLFCFLFLFYLFVICIKQPRVHAYIFSFFYSLQKHHIRNILKPLGMNNFPA